MKLWNNKIARRLYLSFGFLIGLVIISSELNLWLSAQINRRVKDIYLQEVKSLEDLSQIKSALYRVRDRTLRLIDAEDDFEIQHHKKKIEEQIERIKMEIDSYDNTRLSDEEKKELELFKKNLEEYLTVIKREVYPYLKISPKKRLEKALYRKALKEFREARENLNRLINYQTIRAKERYLHAEEILKTQIIFTQFVLSIVVLLSIIYVNKTVNSIINPLREISNILGRISNKDVSQYLMINSQDEFGEISYLINKNIKLLQKTFKELNKLANYDDLTDLPNRKVFNKKLEECIKVFKEKNKKFAVMFIDVDNFKKTNDLHGHIVGDKVLEILAKRIRSLIRSDDLLARLGGDEFGLILCDIKDKNTTNFIAQKILDSVKNPIKIDNLQIHISMSIGIYISESKNISHKEILSFADIAMYKAKQQGKSRFVYFDESMYKELQEEVQLEHDIKEAAINKEFKIYLQPIVDLDNHEIWGAEALLRLQKNNKNISPNKFIPKLESMGLIEEVTYWLIEEIFKLLQKKSFEGIISINLSLLQLFDENFIPFLKDIKKKYSQVSPNKIRFEITESIFAKNSKQIRHIMSLINKEGFLFSLDDFGKGYSSLSYIKDYPISTIKIDKKFVDDLLENKKSQALLEGIIFLANKLQLTIILEGVENENILKLVSKYRNIKIQGYYFFKPMPLKEFIKLMEKT